MCIGLSAKLSHRNCEKAMSPDSPLPRQPLAPEVLDGTARGERKYGYTRDGEKKRILLNAFDMNGIGHIRYDWSRRHAKH